MLSIATGYDPRYLTGEVAKGTENYYTREVGRGEPPGVWNGRGAAQVGLAGEVADVEMEALFVHFVDPRDPAFGGTRRDWALAVKLGRPARKYRTAAQILAESLAREPGVEPERVEQLRRAAERAARKPVAFLDVTFGVPKSFSILHAAVRAQEHRARTAGDEAAAQEWGRRAQLLEDAIWAGNNAALEFLQEHAGFSRAGYHGGRSATGGTVGRWVDAHGWIAASFLQHTNRNEDMHLHIHNAVLNRVSCADGKWRTLDSRAVHRLRGAAGAIAERVMAEQAAATLSLRLERSADGHTVELADVPAAARRLFSSRRREVSAAVKQLAEQHTARYGQEPNHLQLAHMAAQASISTRSPKRHRMEDADERLERWDRQLRAQVDDTLAHIAETAIGASTGQVRAPFDPEQVIALAVEQVQAVKSAWTRYDLIRAIDSRLPPYLGLDKDHTVWLLQRLADRALDQARPESDVVCLAPPELVPVPDALRLADGRPVFEAPAETVYATRAHLRAEDALVHAAAHAHTGTVLEASKVAAALEQLAHTGARLGADQAAAVHGLLTSDRSVGMLVGPAGTGKSTVIGVIAQLWQQHTGGRVFGLATGQHAANILAEEGLPRTENVRRWLDRQTRITNGTARDGDSGYGVAPGDLVIVDEASMTPTADLAEIQARCARAGVRLILAGDERQLGSVGAGGAFRMMVEHGQWFALDEVRRFDNLWEAPASLQLRDGDTDAISIYERYGRVVDGGTPEHTAALAGDAWLADNLAGMRSLLLVDTGEQAAQLSARLRARLVDYGLVRPEGVTLHHEAANGTVAGVGDLIQTRRNDWTLRDTDGRAVINRDLWQVTATTDDGTLHVQRIVNGPNRSRKLGATAVLPSQYVSAHVTLAYALTVHAAQGTTVDSCHPIITSHTTPAALYVAMTRGRAHNVAHVVTATPTSPGKPSGRQAAQEDPPTAGQILSGIMGRVTGDLAALELQQRLLVEAGSMPLLASRWTETVGIAGRQRFEQTLDRLAQNRQLHPSLARRIVHDEAAGAIQRLLRICELAGHDTEDVLAEAISERELGSAISPAQVLHWRITGRHGHTLIPTGDTWTVRTPAHDDPISRYARAFARTLDDRCLTLGLQHLQDPPDWAVQHLGRPPKDQTRRTEWAKRAGTVAGYREQHPDIGNDRGPIGACPTPGQPEARAAWFAAWRALGQPSNLAAETTMATPELVAVIDVYRRQALQAPPWVGYELQRQSATARYHHQEAQLIAAEARVEADPQRRAAALAAAEDHRRLGQGHYDAVDQLTAAGRLRTAWYTHTQPTRDAARRAGHELTRRHLDLTGSPSSGPKSANRQEIDQPTRPERVSAMHPTDLQTHLIKEQTARRVGRTTRQPSSLSPRDVHDRVKAKGDYSR